MLFHNLQNYSVLSGAIHLHFMFFLINACMLNYTLSVYSLTFRFGMYFPRCIWLSNCEAASSGETPVSVVMGVSNVLLVE